MKRRLGYFVGSGVTILWILFFYQYLLFQQKFSQIEQVGDGDNVVSARLSSVLKGVNKLDEDNVRLHKYIERASQAVQDVIVNSSEWKVPISLPVIPVIVFACDRISVNRNLDQLIKYRPSAESFPIYVSQDCGHEPTADVIKGYGLQLTHMKHKNDTPINLPKRELKKFGGYYKIARHYKWGLNQVFRKYNHSAAIIVEDDLDIAPDFFDYFAALYPLLMADRSLWCISAWNDNGKANLIEDNPELLYRTDFFPGLGWMLSRDLWMELEPKWPEKFWDDWMRRPEQRKKRSCVRPEISRTSTFGKKGVSNGQYFDQHLKFIKLNSVQVPWKERNIAYLLKEIYDGRFNSIVYNSPVISLDALKKRDYSNVAQDVPLRIEYRTKDDFLTAAKALHVMNDFKAGVPRTGYRGVVTCVFDNHRIFLAPPDGWTHYDLSWN